MKISSLDLQYIGQLIYETHQLSVTYIDPRGEIIFEYTSKALQKNLNYTSLMEQLTTYPYDTASKDYPIFISMEDFHFFFINLNKDNHYLGALLVGPSLAPVNHHIVTQNFDYDNQSVPTLHYQQFIAISLFVYYLIYQKKLTKTLVMQSNQTLKPIIRHEENTTLELSYARRNDIVHTNLYYEKILLDYVKNGHKEKLNEILNYSIVGEAELGVLSKRNKLRSLQNLMITGIALICRAAIEGGLNEETAFTLSDFYIQKLEEQNSLNDILLYRI